MLLGTTCQPCQGPANMKHSWYTQHVHITGKGHFVSSLQHPAIYSPCMCSHLWNTRVVYYIILYQTIILGILRRSYKTFAIAIIIDFFWGEGGSWHGMFGGEVPHPYRRMNFVRFLYFVCFCYGLTYTVFMQHICHASLLLTKIISASMSMINIMYIYIYIYI